MIEEKTAEPGYRVIIVTRTGQGITAFGKTMSLSAWSLTTGIARSTIYKRLKSGCPPEVAVAAPVTGDRSR